MFEKTDSWLEISDDVNLRSNELSKEVGPKAARKQAVSEAAKVLKRSEVLVRRYSTAAKSLRALLPLSPNIDRNDFGKLPFSTAEFIGRIRSLDEDLAVQWLNRAVDGDVKVLEVRAAYEELAAVIKEERQTRHDDNDRRSVASSSIFEEHKQLQEFRATAEEFGKSLLIKRHHSAIKTTISGSLEKLVEPSIVFAWSNGSSQRDGLGTIVAIPKYQFDYEEILFGKMGRIAFSALHFDEYWLVLESGLSNIGVLKFVKFLNGLEIGSFGIIQHKGKGEFKVLMEPNKEYAARHIPDEESEQ